MGQEHLVVPVVALVEMVLQSSTSETPELALAEEFAANPLAWNGRPVVVNHPEIDGEKVSASIPDVVDAEKIGEIYNAALDDKKLKLEAWINTARVKALGGDIEKTVDRLASGEEIVEVSTGLFANVEEKDGKLEDKEYSGIWRNVVPDHLAILSSAPGACSVDDGCGAPRANNASRANCGNANCTTCNPTTNERKSLFASVKDSLLKILRQSDMDKRNLLRAAIQEKFGMWSWLEAVYDETLVYYTERGELLEISYSIGDDGSVTFGDEATPVVAQVDFVPFVVNDDDDGSTDMDKKAKVQALIANEKSQFTKEDEETLLSMEEGTLDKIIAMEPAVEPAPDADPSGDDAGTGGGEEPSPDGGEVTVETFLSSAPPEVASVLNEGMRLQKENREKLTKAILDNSKNTFTEDELKAMSTEGLEKLATFAEPEEDYSARGGVRTQTTSGDDSAPPKMPLVFEAKKPADNAAAAA